MVARMNSADGGFGRVHKSCCGQRGGGCRIEQHEVISHRVEATDLSARPDLPFHSTSAHITASLVVIWLTSGLWVVQE